MTMPAQAAAGDATMTRWRIWRWVIRESCAPSRRRLAGPESWPRRLG
ncbi:MAG: hypothetical protein QOG05_2260 [Streptosporangiaceae bacterium]|jgi:hypothetical protein|nr:hypothetical protein [Streptosporangiaceae bacterium]